MKLRRLLSILAVGVLLLGFAGTSMASLADLQLYRSVYNTAGSQQQTSNLANLSTDLGLTAGVITQGLNVTGNTFTVSSLGGDFTTLQVAYYAKSGTNGATGDSIWVSGNVAPTWNGAAYSNFWAAAGNMVVPAQGGTNSIAKGTTTSYFFRMDNNAPASGAGAGNFNQSVSIANGYSGEASLSSLAGQGASAYVQQNLYQLIVGQTTATLAGYVRTYEDGHTQIVAAPVPVPASLMLLAPGLLGLIGLRRRSAQDNA